MLVAMVGCVTRTPSRFEGLSPTQARALAEQRAQLREVARQAEELELPAAMVLKRLRGLMEK